MGTGGIGSIHRQLSLTVASLDQVNEARALCQWASLGVHRPGSVSELVSGFLLTGWMHFLLNIRTLSLDIRYCNFLLILVLLILKWKIKMPA